MDLFGEKRLDAGRNRRLSRILFRIRVVGKMCSVICGAVPELPRKDLGS
jgi:hypothetical protein